MTITVDITAPGGLFSPAATGDGQSVTDTISISNGSNVLHTTGITFTSADVGKVLFFSYPSPTNNNTFIGGVITAQGGNTATLTNTFTGTTLTSSSQTVSWGHDDGSAFSAFNTWAVANQGSNNIVLIIPSGKNCLSDNMPQFALGIKNLTVSGYGGALTAANDLNPGQNFIDFTNTNSSLAATVTAGATSVSLLTPSENTRFPSNQWCVLTGVCLQTASNPPNPGFFEYLQVGTNPGTGVIPFTSPLKNTYKQTWPLYDGGSPSTFSQGGPATLYALDSTWDSVLILEGLTIASPSVFIAARSVTLQDVTFNAGAGNDGLAPHAAQTFTMNNVTHTNAALMEADKMIDTLVINGGTYGEILIASACLANQMTISGATIATLAGSPISGSVSNCTIGTLAVGSTHFGVTDQMTFTACAINTTLEAFGSIETNIDTNYQMANGVISIATATLLTLVFPLAWAVPGAHCMFGRYSGGIISEGYPFQVLDLYQDATNTYVKTNLPGGFPNVPRDGTTGLSIWAHPCPNITFNACTGNYQISSLAGAIPARPFLSYNRRTFFAGDLPLYTGQTLPENLVFGRITSITVTVNVPYSGVDTPLLMNLNPFGLAVIDAYGNEVSYNPLINLSQAGTRTILPGVATAGLSGDTIPTLAGSVWLETQYAPVVNADISGQGSPVSVTIQINTDQGIPPVPDDINSPLGLASSEW